MTSKLISRKVLLLPLVPCTPYLNLNLEPSENSLKKTSELVSSAPLRLLTALPSSSLRRRTDPFVSASTSEDSTESQRKTGTLFPSSQISSPPPAKLVPILR